MPTLLGHPAIPLSLGLALGRKTIPAPLLAAGILASVLPDLDVVAFRLGIPYASGWGHRGFSHSLVFALAVAALGAIGLRVSKVPFLTALWYLFLSTASHGLLDMFTTGGLGVALFWPWSEARFFAPFQFIQVSPLSFDRFLSPRGLAVLRSEFAWVWLPCLLMAGGVAFLRQKGSRSAPPALRPSR
jgi:inner membrane protein